MACRLIVLGIDVLKIVLVYFSVDAVIPEKKITFSIKLPWVSFFLRNEFMVYLP